MTAALRFGAPTLGATLPNGRVVVAVKAPHFGGGSIVLCLAPDSPTPFVTWWVSHQDGAAYHGHYFCPNELAAAVADFEQRG